MSVLSKRIATIGVGVILAAVGIGACGGSDDGGSDEPLTKDEYIAQADQICADATAENESLEAEFSSAYDAGDFEAAADSLAEANDGLQSAFDEVEALEPPEEDQATIDEWLSLSQEQLDQGSEVVDAVRSGDQAAIDEVIGESDDLQQRSDAIADEYGMTDCGSAGSDA